MPKITELDSVISLDGNDVLPIVSKNNNNEDETMKIAVNAIGTKLLNSNEYGALNTTDKKIIGAINEVNTKASQFEVTGTLLTGATSITLSDASITTTSTIDIYTDVFGIQPTNAVVASGSITLTFLAQASDITVKVRVS